MGKRSGAARRAKANGSRTPFVSGSERYQVRRLARVREQLDRIDKMLMAETDPQRLDRLAAASMRLSDQEFALANRPKPAQARVTPQGRTRRELPPPMPIQEPEASKPTSGDVPPQSITPSQPAVPGASGT